MTRGEKRQLTIVGLFYPAFLGNMTYVAAEKLFKSPDFFDWGTGLLVCAVLLHYVMDWIHTAEADHSRYKPAMMVWDASIVVCLYVVLRLVLQEEGVLTGLLWPLLAMPIVWLFATKIFSFAWELVETSTYNPFNLSPKRHLSVFIDIGFAAAYLLLGLGVACLSPSPLCANLALAFVVTVDAIAYAVFNHIRSKRKTAGA